MQSEKQPLMSTARGGVPAPFWAAAVPSRRNASRYLPQTIAHRGYKASWPENSMGAFRGAVEVGAHAIETDVHLSADGIVVLSHDASLKRCFGVDKKISACSWEYLSQLRTLRAPHEALPRLTDLLEYLAEPGIEKIWVTLDIKMDDKPEELLGAIAKAIASVPESVSWNKRIVLGCWNATFVEAAVRTLPGFPIALITFALSYAQHFLPIPNLGISMLQKTLVGPPGSRFLRRAQRGGHPVFAWTVNDEASMEWCIRRNEPQRGEADGKALGVRLLDGVITDDPKLFLEVCERWEDELDGRVAPRRRGLARRVREGAVMVPQFVFMQVAASMLYILSRFVAHRLDVPEDVRKRRSNEIA